MYLNSIILNLPTRRSPVTIPHFKAFDYENDKRITKRILRYLL